MQTIKNPLINDLQKRFLEIFRSNDAMLILYGSAVTGKTTSDFDFCIIKNSYTKDDIENATNISIDFHKKHMLKLDAEVPYENKLIYSANELHQTINKSPFKVKNNKISIDEIEKSKAFLSSSQMKQRLLFFVLTADSILLAGNKDDYTLYKAKAWDTLTKVMFSYNNNDSITEKEFIDNLFTNQYTNKSGENYLGYKRGRMNIVDCLTKKTHKYFEINTKLGNLHKINDTYTYDVEKLQQFTHDIKMTTLPSQYDQRYSSDR